MAKSAAKKAIASAKRAFFDKLMTSEVSSHHDLGQAWKSLKALKNNFRIPPAPLSVNGKVIEADRDKAEIFADEFAKVSQTSSLSAENILHRQREQSSPFMSAPPADNSQTFNAPLTLCELTTAISSISSKKVAVGPDGISYAMIKHFPPSFLDVILSLLQLCFSRGVFPSRWKHSHIVPIHKQGKPRNQASSYRPISLTPHLSKVYERILKARLEHHSEAHSFLPTCQAGFRRYRSISDHLLTLTSSIKTAVKKRRCLTAVFFDVRRAFDTVWHQKLLSKLRQLGLSGHLYKAIESFLFDRSFSVRVRSTLSSTRQTDCGVPQGTVLAPLLYNLMIFDLPQYILDRCGDSVSISQYADDLAIWLTHMTKSSTTQQTKKKTQKLIQNALDAVHSYMFSNGFSLAPEKTQLVHFTRDPSFYLPPLTLNGTPLAPQKQAKFLGVLFSHDLSWSAHIHHLLAKASRALNLLKVAVREPWGNNPQTLLHLSIALVRSRLSHGQECFHAAPQTLLDKLTSLDTRGIKIALGLPVHCSHSAAYSEASILPLDNTRQLAVSKLLVRSYSVPNSSQPSISRDFSYDRFRSQQKSKHLTTPTLFASPLLQSAKVFPPDVAPRPIPPIPPWLTLSPEVHIPSYKSSKADQPHQLRTEVLELLNTKYSQTLQIFTDGSLRDDGSVGSGVAIPALKLSKSYSLPQNLSIFTAELSAITMALQTVLSLPSTLTAVTLGVDSQAALKAISSPHRCARSDILVEIRQLCHTIISQNTILTFLWVPSHIGVHGNDLADSAAREGAAATPSSLPLKIAPSVSELNSRLSKATYSNWDSERAILFSFKPYPCYLPHSHNFTLSMPRALGAFIRRLRTNSWYAKHISLKCPCSAPLSPEHAVLHCPRYASEFAGIRSKSPTNFLGLLADPLIASNIAKLLYPLPCSVHF